jgi:AcrR family transcriptional regulator
VNRDDILKQAAAIVEHQGDDALSMRGLARDLGVSAPALYEHIDSRDELLRALAQEGYSQLAKRWSDIEGPPLTWLMETGRAYVHFAVDHPALFTLMHRFAPQPIIGDPVVEHAAATALFDEGLTHIQAAIDAGDLREGDPLDIALALWAAGHGVATVAVMLPGTAGVDELTDRVIGGLLAGLGPNAHLP